MIILPHKTSLTRKLMGDDKMSSNFQSAKKPDFILNDYLEYQGRKYYLNRPPTITKGGSELYNTSIELEGDIYSLLDRVFRLDGVGEFTINGDLEFFIDLLISQTDTIVKGEIEPTESKTLSFNNVTLRAALNQLLTEFEVEYILNSNVLDVKFEVGANTVNVFQYGSSLYTLARKNVDSSSAVSRVFGQGANRNLPDGYPYKYLKFNDDGKDYLEDTSGIGRIVETFYSNTEIYPRFIGAITNNPTPTNNLELTIDSLDFDINEQLVPGKTAKVYFRDGDLQGRELEIEWAKGTQIRVIPETDETGATYPNEFAYAKLGDSITFLDIYMPDSYVENAEQELLDATQVYLDENKSPRVDYDLSVSYRYLRKNNISFDIGDFVTVIDEDLGINKKLRVTEITVDNINYPEIIKAKISDYVAVSFVDRVVNQTIQSRDNLVQETKDRLEQRRLLQIAQSKASNKRYKGEWDSETIYYNNQYLSDTVRDDATGIYYLFIGANETTAPEPPNEAYWEELPSFDVIASDLILAQEVVTDKLTVAKLRTKIYDAGDKTTFQRMEITNVDNTLRLFNPNANETVLIDDEIDSQAYNQSSGGIRTSNNAGDRTSIVSGSGVFANASNQRFLSAATGTDTNASIVGLLFDRNSDNNGFSAGVVGIDTTTTGSSKSYAAIFLGGVYQSQLSSKDISIPESTKVTTSAEFVNCIRISSNGSSAELEVTGNNALQELFIMNEGTFSISIVDTISGGSSHTLSPGRTLHLIRRSSETSWSRVD